MYKFGKHQIINVSISQAQLFYFNKGVNGLVALGEKFVQSIVDIQTNNRKRPIKKGWKTYPEHKAEL